jgi:hypothetical protein
VIPLEQRVCFTAMVNRIPSDNSGGHPRCIGVECSNYESCQATIEEASCKLKKLQAKKPVPLQKIRRDE